MFKMVENFIFFYHMYIFFDKYPPVTFLLVLDSSGIACKKLSFDIMLFLNETQRI